MNIVSIEEDTFPINTYTDLEGFIITLDNGEQIRLGICNSQSCCEQWGYFITNDNKQEFIGAEFKEIKIADCCLNPAQAPDKDEWYEGGIMYVNIETNKGTLQFTAYNQHNGYYGHQAGYVYLGQKHLDVL